MEAGITNWIDFLVIGLYFAIVITVGLMSMCRKDRESVQGYFLAGRSMTWLPIGASLFASNIGSEHFVGLAGSGAASGIGVVSFEWGAVLLLMLLGWVFLPIYLTAGVFTMPEYLGRRFGGTRMRIYLSLVALALYVATKVSVDMYAGVFFIQLATGWDMYLSMIPLLAVTALYTIAGGLAAVVLTDTLQTLVMLIGAIVLAVMAFIEVGGFNALFIKYMNSVADPWTASDVVAINDSLITSLSSNITTTVQSPTTTLSSFYRVDNETYFLSSNTTCGRPRSDAFHMFRDPVNSDLPWPGVIFRATFASLWNWCADQVIVQRALAAKNMAHARGATILAGYLKFTPLFLIIFPGMISRVLYTDQIACTNKAACLEACGNEAGCSNSAYPYLILKLAPVGIKGLLMAVMVAALMSSLTSIFNSAVTVFTMDLWRRARPDAKEKELLIVGRFFVIVLVGVSIAWIPLIMQSQEGQLFMYIQSVTGYIAPPISAIFLMAVLIPRINEKGAFVGVICGQTVGIIRLVLDFVYPSPGCGHEDDRPSIVSKLHFTYFSVIVFGVTACVALIVSLLTEPQDKRDIENLTFWSLRSEKKRLSRSRKKSKTTGESFINTAGGSAKSDWRHRLTESNEEGKDQWQDALKRFKDTSFTITSNRHSTGDNVRNMRVQQSGRPHSYDELQILHNKTHLSQNKNTIDGMEDVDLDKDSSGDPAIKVEIDVDHLKVLDKFENIVQTFKSTVDQPWATILNINAIILLLVLGFLCGFFH